MKYLHRNRSSNLSLGQIPLKARTLRKSQDIRKFYQERKKERTERPNFEDSRVLLGFFPEGDLTLQYWNINSQWNGGQGIWLNRKMYRNCSLVRSPNSEGRDPEKIFPPRYLKGRGKEIISNKMMKRKGLTRNLVQIIDHIALILFLE